MDDSRARLKKVAIDALRTHGVQGLSFRELAKQMGIKSSSVHYHFPKKIDLIHEILQDYSADFLAALGRIEETVSQPDEQIAAAIDLYRQCLRNGQFCLCGMLAAEFRHTDEETRQQLHRFFEQLQSWFEGALKRKGVQGDPKATAGLLVSGLEGALLIDTAQGTAGQLENIEEFAANL